MEDQIQFKTKTSAKMDETLDKSDVVGERQALQGDVNDLLEGKATAHATSAARHAMGPPRQQAQEPPSHQ